MYCMTPVLVNKDLHPRCKSKNWSPKLNFFLGRPSQSSIVEGRPLPITALPHFDQCSQLQHYCLFFSFNFKLFGEPCTHINLSTVLSILVKQMFFSLSVSVMLVKLRITSLVLSQKSKNFPHLKAQRSTCIRLLILLVTINSMTNLSSLFYWLCSLSYPGIK